MNKSINKVILVGHLGKDPETRSMPNGTLVTTFNLATTDRKLNRAASEPDDHAEWHRVVFLGELAETAGQALNKGSHVYIEGTIFTRQWEQHGRKHSRTEVIGRDLLLLNEQRPVTEVSEVAENTPNIDEDLPF